jgi:hypothetical protein
MFWFEGRYSFHRADAGRLRLAALVRLMALQIPEADAFLYPKFVATGPEAAQNVFVLRRIHELNTSLILVLTCSNLLTSLRVTLHF